MKHTIHPLLYLSAIISLIMSISSCRTTEANYRTAYNRAIDGRRDSSIIDNTIYDSFRRKAINQTKIVGNDTIDIKRDRVKLQDSPTGTPLQSSYAVVAQFKQLFNARSMRDRLKSAGYNDAVLLVTPEPLYYVALGGGDSPAAVTLLKQFSSTPVIATKDPYPLILEPVK